MEEAVRTCHHRKVTVSSNIAREYAIELAAAASMGYITTLTGDRIGRVWRPTATGLHLLEAA